MAHFERTGREMTRTALANRLGVTRANVSAWEKGLYEPPRKVIEAVAAELGVTVEW